MPAHLAVLQQSSNFDRELLFFYPERLNQREKHEILMRTNTAYSNLSKN